MVGDAVTVTICTSAWVSDIKRRLSQRVIHGGIEEDLVNREIMILVDES